MTPCTGRTRLTVLHLRVQSRAELFCPKQGTLENSCRWTWKRLGERRADRSIVATALIYVRYLDDFPVISDSNIWTDDGDAGVADEIRSTLFRPTRGNSTLHSHGHRPRRPRPRPDLRLRHHRLCRRAMGPPLDHHRHLPRRTRPGPRPHHGRPLSLLPARRFARRPASRRPRSPARRPSSQPTHGDIRHGFVYERVPHITLKSIANNAEIDVIWDKWQETLEPLRESLNAAMKQQWEEWEIPRAAEDPWPTEPLRLFSELRIEQARGDNARASKIEDGLRAINKALKRDYTSRRCRIARSTPGPNRRQAARRLVAGPHRPPEGDRRLHRRQGRFRVPLRQALHRQQEGPRRRPLHRREPVAPPRAGRR